MVKWHKKGSFTNRNWKVKQAESGNVGNLSSKNWELKQENSELKQLNGFTNIVLFL